MRPTLAVGTRVLIDGPGDKGTIADIGLDAYGPLYTVDRDDGGRSVYRRAQLARLAPEHDADDIKTPRVGRVRANRRAP